MKPHEAWRKWLDSDQGKQLTEPDLEPKPGHRRYMENRLHRAFMAGWRDSEERTREIIVGKIDAWIKQSV